MLKKLKKGIVLGTAIAFLTKKEATKHISKFVKSKNINAKTAKTILLKVHNEAKREGKRIENFMLNELKREISKAKPFFKKSTSKVKKAVKRKLKKKSKKKR
jgi:polyhydroxyalkanoate synthesis regulator phasin